jgi:hypothetical protein
LKQVESQAIDGLNLVVVVPSTILFVAFDAIPYAIQLSIADCDSCPDFDRWRHLRECGIAVNFRSILRIGSSFQCLNDYLIGLSEFQESSLLGGSTGILSEIICDVIIVRR